MIKFHFLLLTAYLGALGANAQGTYAGSMKNLIGMKYKDSRSIAALKSFEYHESGLISDINDPESITVDHCQKGTMAVIFFSLKEDPNAEEYTIVDVLEFKNIPAGWELKTAFCRQNENENGEIVALVKSGKDEYLKPAKQAWIFNRGKRKLQPFDKEGVDCLGAPGT